MFKIFSFGFGSDSNLNGIGKINEIVKSFLDNMDISETTDNYEETLKEETFKRAEDKNTDFIKFIQYEEMYILTINLRGIDLRELSIQYDPGIIEINVNRSEIQKSGFGILSNNVLVKRAYNKKFDNIEDINTDQIFKSIDNGILSMRMPKKYVLESEGRVIEVDYYEDNVDN